MNTPRDTSRLTFEPPRTRPDGHTWTGPCKSAGCHALRDFIVLVLCSAAIVTACFGCGVL